jgi:hypothetical protein
LGNKDVIANRPGLGRYGAPCVLRFSPDLKTLQNGTYLEGWQQIWDKHRVVAGKPVHKTFPPEYFWQPTDLGLLKSGDVVVSHDGGYFRRLTDKDRQLAQETAERLVQENPNPPPGKAGEPAPDQATRLAMYRAAMLRRLPFYDVCDWMSRLSPDLTKRVWRKAIYTPATDPETAKRLKDGWPFAYLSNPRACRMRLDKDENIYLAGWSASATKSESYWDPYLWKLDPKDGNLIWKAYEYDPMGGKDNRINGNVADTAVLTVALDQDQNVLACLISDGGNTVMGGTPKAELGKAFEGPFKGMGGGGLTHFHGRIVRFDAQTREGLAGARTGRVAWTVDVAALPQKHVLALGRCNFGVEWSADAWQKSDPNENPTGYLRVYSPDFDLLYSTALRGVVPYEIIPLAEKRFLIVGESKGTLSKVKWNEDKTYELAQEANPGLAPVKNALQAKPQGKNDGYLMIVEWKEPAPKPAAREAPPF